MLSSDIDLSEKFLNDDIPTRELEAMMQVCFGQAKQISENEVIYFDSDAKNYGIRIRYEDDEIVSISGGLGLSNDKLDFVLNQIHSALLAEQGKAVGGNVLFNYYPTNGFFRYDDIFQIRPVPPEDPRPEGAVPDHPCVLEVSFKNSPNSIIRNLRGGDKITELGLLLHTLLEGAIKLKPGTISFHWVLLPKECSKEKQFAYCQDWYKVSDMPVKTSEFTSNENWKPMELVDPTKYYSDSNIIELRSLRVPSDLGTSIIKFYELVEKTRTVFLRACHWSHLSTQIAELSKSASFVAKVSAIETLLPKQTVKGVCSSCKQEIKDGSTKTFRDFVETFAHDSGVSPEAKKELYRVRSKLVHGHDVLSADFFLQHWGLHPGIWTSMQQFWELAQVVKTVIVMFQTGQEKKGVSLVRQSIVVGFVLG